MYITVTRQQMDATYLQSASDLVAYLEKENEGKDPELQEPFFDQYNDRVAPEKVIKEIDGNTAKLKKREPKFYSLTINPSQGELKSLGNDPAKLRAYVREAMKEYAAAFHREVPVTVDQLKYYAKIEHQRHYKGRDREVRENRPFRAKIAKLGNELRKVERGELAGDPVRIQREISRTYEEMPHKIGGRPIEQGMKKPGHQMHVHIVMSRKDVTNRYSLSPGSSYRGSEAALNGKTVKRGFDRDRFFQGAERTFDRMFGHRRNYAESYSGRKALDRDPVLFFAKLAKLPTSERSAALKVLGKAGARIPLPDIPKGKMDLVLKSIRQLKKGLDLARGSGSIEI